MMRKILFVCYDGYNTTNVRVRCYRFARELKKARIKADVFSFKDHLDASYDGFESYKVSWGERFLLLLRAIRRLIKEDKSTVFYIQKCGFFALAPYFVHLVKGNKYILDYDDYEYEQSAISKYLVHLIAKRAVFCVAASKYLQQFLKRFNKNVYYVPTGVDLDVFKKKSYDFGKLKKEVVFTWIGIIVDKEALQNLLFIVDGFDEASKKNKNVRLEIVGGGDYMKDVVKRMDELGNSKIRFLGRMMPDEIPNYLKKVDAGLFVLVKDTRYNRSKSPTKLFEYMAVGLAPLCTKVGESGKIIDNKKGLVFEGKEKYVYFIGKLAKNPNLVRKLGTAARKSAEQSYNLEVLGKRLSEIISKA